MASIKEQMASAKAYIQAKDYANARRILKQIDHPQAQKILRQLNDKSPPTFAEQWNVKYRYWVLIGAMALMLGGVGYLIATGIWQP